MAKNAKKITSLGIRPEDFQETRIPAGEAVVHTHTHTHEQEYEHNHKQVHNDTHVHEQTHKPVPVENQPAERVYEHTHTHEPVARVKKERRVQWLTYDSLVQRIDAYAKERGVSRADVLEVGMEKFLSDLGK